MDDKTFNGYMKKEYTTLNKYQAASKETFGKTFKVSIDLKETYKKKLGDQPLFTSRDD